MCSHLPLIGAFVGTAAAIGLLAWRRRTDNHDVSDALQEAKVNALAQFVRQLQDVFDEADVNRDGWLDATELHNLLVSKPAIESRLARTRGTSLAMFQHIDKNNDGRISRQEFLQAFVPAAVFEVHFRDMFTAADTDRDGMVSRAELDVYLNHHTHLIAYLEGASISASHLFDGAKEEKLTCDEFLYRFSRLLPK